MMVLNYIFLKSNDINHVFHMFEVLGITFFAKCLFKCSIHFETQLYTFSLVM